MVAVLTWSNDARMFIERKGDIGLECQAGAFKDDLGRQFISHGSNYKRLYGMISTLQASYGRQNHHHRRSAPRI